MNQSIFRVTKDKDNPYVMLNKTFLNDSSMSLKAKGLLAYFLSLPDDWQIYESEITNHHKDGRDSIRSTIKELMDLGYISRTRKRNANGQMSCYEYSVYEVSNHIGLSNVGKTNVGKSNTTNNDITNIAKHKINRKPTKRNKSEYSNYALDKTAEFANVLVKNM